uniref:Plus3 domain-containing protein n=1 Tax=Meloidogyne hapla TaxID=6305 RepID=A0A1I8B1F7_MELHA
MSIESNQCSSHFVNGISNNNSIFHQSIQYPDEPSEGIRACIIGRERIYKLLVSPDFAKTIVDCFVRIVDQNSSDDSKKYKIARVVSVLDGVDHDCYGQNNGTLLQLDDKTEINLDVISEEPAEEIEIQQWLMSMIRKNKPTPSNGQLRNKITEIASALSWPFSPSDKHIETDYYSLYEKTNLAGNIDDSEITDVEHVLTDVIECLENEEVNECQMDQEIAETMVIDQMTGEQVFPEHEDSEMGMNIDNIPSEFSQVSDNNEGLRQSNNRSNQVCTNSDGLIVGYLTEDNRFKIYIADDEGINGSAISPNKHGTKEKNCIEYIEYLEDILPIILSKTFLIQIMHSSEFNQLVTDCFVFIKHKTNSNENNEMSMESTNKEEYKLARICKVEDTENVYCYEELFYQKRILLDSNDDIFELSLNNVLDRQPTNEEFKNWVLAISNKTKKLIKTIIPTLQFVITKHVKIDTCRTNSLREKNLQLYKLANSETAIIYEKQKKVNKLIINF